MTTVEISEAACTACSVCVEICPTDVFTVAPETGRPQVTYLEDCQACFLCEIDCVFEAIRVFPR